MASCMKEFLFFSKKAAFMERQICLQKLREINPTMRSGKLLQISLLLSRPPYAAHKNLPGLCEMLRGHSVLRDFKHEREHFRK